MRLKRGTLNLYKRETVLESSKLVVRDEIEKGLEWLKPSEDGHRRPSTMNFPNKVVDRSGVEIQR